jgi:hypothetical protein
VGLRGVALGLLAPFRSLFIQENNFQNEICPKGQKMSKSSSQLLTSFGSRPHHSSKKTIPT